MWTATQYRRLVQGGAWYDLIVTVAFVTPWSLRGVAWGVDCTEPGVEFAW